MFSVAPTLSTTSAWAINSAAIGEAKPPEMPRSQGLPAKRPLATAEVASSAPRASPRRSSGSPGMAGEGAMGDGGGREQRSKAAAQALQRLAGVGEDGAAPGHDQRPAGAHQ